jgi:serpin B
LIREITMNRRDFICLAIIASLQSRARANVPAERAKENVGAMNNAFAIDLYSRLSADSGNLFFSPTSVQTALAMAAAGARGQTAAEMSKTLHLDATPDAGDKLGAFLRDLNVAGSKGGYELSVANALWGLTGYPFSPAYLSSVEKTYGGHLADLSFTSDPEGSRKTINDWVADKTHDKITNLLPPGSIVPTTRLVLTNAIYFKGKWDKPFQKARTHDAEFSTSATKKVNAPFMYQQAKFKYAEDSEAQVLELPYGQGRLAMRIYLPKSADQLQAVEKGLTTSHLAELTDQLKSEDVRVWLPRFKVETEYRLEEVLPGMGMKLAFQPGRADFSGMTSASNFFISAVIHKAYVQTDEEGTEAAAATGVGMRATAVMARHEPKIFRADHPFVFQIADQQSGAILFMGRLAAP